MGTDGPSLPSGPGPERCPERRNETMVALQEALGGRYALERVLGQGGMGIVYLAWEWALERRVALKLLPPALADERRERFLREAKIAARLTHDHIVPIYAVDQAGPYVYYTMQYVPGETLAQRILIEGPLPVGEVTRILHDVARAVAYAHQQGVIHRDLKPQNILIERETGRVYVADFGLARVMNEGLLPGGGGGRTFATWAYASPEQAAGLPTDHRSDIYSLGVVGYVMATGELPFTGKPAEVLRQHISTPAPPLRVLNRHLDTTLTRAVARCLAKDSSERFQTADELARVLSLAPELRADLPKPLGEFVSRLKLEARRSAVGGVFLGIPALGVLGRAAEAGQWGTAAGALAFLGLLMASPVVGALPATRRLLRQGYTRADILHALNMDLDHQREQLASGWGRARDATATVWRRIAVFAVSLFSLGAVAAGAGGAGVPEGVVMGSMLFGALTTVAAGGVLIWREWRRNQLEGYRWLRFWQSPLGAWTVKLAGVGLGPVPVEPELLEPEAARPPLLAHPPGATSSELDDVRGVADRTEACIRRGRACLAASSATREREGRTTTPEELELEQTLERQLAVLEALLGKFLTVDAGTADPGSLTADLEAARAVCEAVEGLIEGREFRP